MISFRQTVGVSLCLLAPAALLADNITVQYSGYGHSGNATQPAAGSSFNTGNIDTSGQSNSSHSDNLTTSDNLANGPRNLTHTYTGTGTNFFTAQSNLQSIATVNDPNYIANKQFDGSNYRYIGFQVDQTANYFVSGLLTSRNVILNPGSAGNYGYYGMGGGGNVEISNFPNPNTTIYTFNVGGNIADPAANTVVYTFSTSLNLTAGVQYQLNFNNYLYSGFGGTGSIEHNAGWEFTISANAVPEPGTIALCGIALAGVGIAFRKRIKKAVWPKKAW
jgi:hypothetical protein